MKEENLKIIQLANEMFKGSRPLDGEELRILNETAKRVLSKTPTTLNKMKTTFTTEQLQNFYKQAMQYCVAAYGSEPDRITIEEDGTLHACWEHYHCGETEYEYEYISPERLTEDLVAVYEERKRKEEEARIQAEKERLERQKLYDAQQKEKRKQEYLKLKKEFEQ